MAERKQPLISIIVPVYQVKDYVSECVESLLAQTYTNLEILLVDDGSTDGSGEICDEYARRDGRIRVIHQENQGLSAARNKGLDQMRGEYLAFVDSDDMIEPDFIEALYDLTDKYRADIAACAYARGEMKTTICTEMVKRGRGGNDLLHAESGHGIVYGGTRVRSGKAKAQGMEQELCMTSEQMLRQWHGKYKKWETIACNKLYRKQILNGPGRNGKIRFPIGRRHEDVLTSHLIVANASQIVLTTRELYLYRVREGSITARAMRAERRRENLLAQRERMGFFIKRRYWRAYLNLLAGYVLHVGWFMCMRVRRWK